MKKALLAIILVGVFITFYSNPFQAALSSETVADHPLYKSFEASGAEPYELKVQGWAKLNNEYLSMEQLLDTVRKVQDGLGVSGEFTMEQQEYEGMRGVTAIKELTPGEYAVIIVQTLDRQDEGAPEKPETYLIVTMSQPGNFKYMLNYRQKVAGAFEKCKVDGNISTYLTGTINKQLTKRQRNVVLNQMFQTVGAGDLDGINNESLISFSGYTSSLDDYVTVGDRKININIALRYHENDAKTYVYLGSPLLEGEY